jgi:hypothetical protein
MRSWDPKRRSDKVELARIAGEIAALFPPRQIRHQYCAKSLYIEWPDTLKQECTVNAVPDDVMVKTETNETSIFEIFPDQEHKWFELIDHLEEEGIDRGWMQELAEVICEARQRNGRPRSTTIEGTLQYRGDTYRPVLYRVDRRTTSTEYHVIFSKQPGHYYASRVLNKVEWYDRAIEMLDEAKSRGVSDEFHWIMATSTYLLLPEEAPDCSESELRKTYFDKIANVVSAQDGPRYALLITPAFSEGQSKAIRAEMHNRYESFNAVDSWCSNKVEIKRARMAGVDILITNRAVLFHVRTYRKGWCEEPRRVGIYIGSDKIAKEFRAWFWDTFESDQAETIDIGDYAEWGIPPLVPTHIPTVVSADFGIFSELGAGHFHRRRAL